VLLEFLAVVERVNSRRMPSLGARSATGLYSGGHLKGGLTVCLAVEPTYPYKSPVEDCYPLLIDAGKGVAGSRSTTSQDHSLDISSRSMTTTAVTTTGMVIGRMVLESGAPMAQAP
jgi:hypothetical protein